MSIQRKTNPNLTQNRPTPDVRLGYTLTGQSLRGLSAQDDYDMMPKLKGK